MKPIIFARVADMKYYRGIASYDEPENGGSYVNDTGLAHECYNFDPVEIIDESSRICFGYCQLSGGINGAGQLHIEKIVGCNDYKNEALCDGITVVFVSKSKRAKTMRVVGFYKNATVYRYPQLLKFDSGYEQTFWFKEKENDCVVLPYSTRHSQSNWFVPNSTTQKETFGMGRSNIWYAGGKGASKAEIEYVEKMLSSIENYMGENWMGKEVQQ